MLIYNQFLLLNMVGDFFQDSLINKKLKRTVFIQNRNVTLQYTLLFKSLGSAHFFFFYKFILLFNKDVLNG